MVQVERRITNEGDEGKEVEEEAKKRIESCMARLSMVRESDELLLISHPRKTHR